MTTTPAERTRAWRQRPGNAERERATKAAYKAANPEKVAAQKAASHARHYAANRERHCEQARAVREALRAEIVEAYGGVCACPGCHVHHAVLLTVDHVAGDGAEHRRQLGRSTRDLYRWIKRHDFPPEFQLLCGSCNLAKGTDDKCPLAGEDH